MDPGIQGAKVCAARKGGSRFRKRALQETAQKNAARSEKVCRSIARRSFERPQCRRFAYDIASKKYEAAKRTGSSVGIRVGDSNLPRLWRRRDWLAEPLPARRAEHTQEAGTEEQDGAGLRGNVLGLGELTANLAAWESGIMDVDVRFPRQHVRRQRGLCARGGSTVSG